MFNDQMSVFLDAVIKKTPTAGINHRKYAMVLRLWMRQLKALRQISLKRFLIKNAGGKMIVL